MLSLLLCLMQDASPALPRLGGFLSEQRGLCEPAAALFGPDGTLAVVETHAGRVTGAGLALENLRDPRGLARSDDGAWFVSDAQGILVIRPGKQSRITLSGARAEGLAWTAQALYVADSQAHCVRVLDPHTGNELDRIGTRGSAAGELLGPRDVAVSASGEVFVADTGNHRVQVFSTAGAPLRRFGDYGPYPGLFSSPSGIDFAQDSIFVADTGNHRIQRFRADGEFQYGFGAHSIRPRDGAGRLHYPTQLAVAADGQRIAVVEGFEDRVQLFGEETPQSRVMELQNELSASAHYGGALALGGRLCVVLEPESSNAVVLDTSGLDPVEISRLGRFGDKPDLFARPSSVALDGAGERAYFADALRGRVSRFSLARGSTEPLRYDLLLPRLECASDTRNLPGGAGFEPRAIARASSGSILALAADGSLWRAGADLRRWRRIAPPDAARAGCTALAVDTSSDQIALANPTDGTLEIVQPDGSSLALLREPAGSRPSAVAWTRRGTLVLTDERRHEVRERNREGQELLRIGQPGLGRAEFFKPRGIAVDAQGRWWVLDAGNHRVQILSAEGVFLHAFGSRLFTEPLRKGYTPPEQPEWTTWPAVSSAQHRYRIHYKASQWPPSVGETLAIEAHLVPLEELTKEPALVLDGGMPEHGHGLPRDTRATRLGDRHWKFEGLRLHMGGRWRLYFDIHEGAHTERAEWEVVLE
jgi:DNA-binding beta-propeller fold protein YncE